MNMRNLPNLKLSTQVLLLVLIPLVLQIFFVITLMLLLQQAELERERVDDSRHVVMELNRLITTLMGAAGGVAANAISGEDSFGVRYDNFESQLRMLLNDLENRLYKKPVEYSRLESMKVATEQGAGTLSRIKKLLKKGDRMQSLAQVRTLKPLLAQISTQAESVMDTERLIEQNSPKIQQEYRQGIQAFLIGVLIFNVVMGLFFVFLFKRRFTQRLETLVDNSVRLAIGKPLHDRLQGEDELARLDRVFHRMAESLAAASRKERAVIENARDVICSISEEDRFTAVNPASQDVWGYEPDELLGAFYIDYIHPEDRERARATIKKLETEKQDLPLEVRFLRKDEKAMDMLWSMHWSAQERAFFCVAHDISERKRIERMKQEFVAMVSHDLRTPLSAIKGTLSMIAEGVYDVQSERGKQRLGFAQDSIDRLIHLINDLLDIEKLEAGMMQIVIEPVALDDVIVDSIGSVRGFAEERKITLDYQGCDESVLADEDRLIQVLVNLLSNAIKFSDAGETVAVQVRSSINEQTEVRVIDHGRGIPEQHKEVIFERFKQVEVSDSKRKSGTGLGLAICRAIVEAHGGRIGVESSEGKGSTFWFRVPSAKSADKLAAV